MPKFMTTKKKASFDSSTEKSLETSIHFHHLLDSLDYRQVQPQKNSNVLDALRSSESDEIISNADGNESPLIYVPISYVSLPDLRPVGIPAPEKKFMRQRSRSDAFDHRPKKRSLASRFGGSAIELITHSFLKSRLLAESFLHMNNNCDIEGGFSSLPDLSMESSFPVDDESPRRQTLCELEHPDTRNKEKKSLVKRFIGSIRKPSFRKITEHL